MPAKESAPEQNYRTSVDIDMNMLYRRQLSYRYLSRNSGSQMLGCRQSFISLF